MPTIPRRPAAQRKRDLVVGRAAIPQQPCHARLAEHPTPLAGSRTPARLRAGAQPGRRPVVQPEGRRAGQLTAHTLLDSACWRT